MSIKLSNPQEVELQDFAELLDKGQSRDTNQLCLLACHIPGALVICI